MSGFEHPVALIRARSFFAVDPGVARGALATGYLLPRLLLWFQFLCDSSIFSGAILNPSE